MVRIRKVKRLFEFSRMRIVPVALNSDNYGYVIISQKLQIAAIVDISNQPEIVKQVVNDLQVEIRMILTTHKHWDHAGGNLVMKSYFPDAEILGSEIDNVEGCTRYIQDNEEISLDDITIRCIHTPGHTLGHICYFAQDGDQMCVFTGDTLFCGGVGKFFEGTAEDMHNSLQKLIKLPPQTEIYCGHEYTVSNYRFALSIDEENQDLIDANNEAISLRSEGKFTIPSTIEKELKVNPFLRVLESSIRSKYPSVTQDDPIALLAAVREAKNNF